MALYTSPLKWVVMLAPLAFVFFFAFRASSMSVPAAQASFWIYAALVGASISAVLLDLHGRLDRARVLHLGGDVRKLQRLGLHDEA